MDSLIQFSELNERLSEHFTDDNNNNNNNDDFDSVSVIATKEDKYSLRPRSMRRVTEPVKQALTESSNTRHKSNKPKQKAAPLSKYRRKTANARERNRMREINQAFETLRRVIPHMHQNHQSVPAANEKLTKITTLRLAMKYITALSAALNGINNANENHNHKEATIFSADYDLDCLLLESDGESLPLSDHSLLASPDFPEASLSPVDFSDPSLPALLHTDFTEHALEPADFSDFLLT